METATKAIWWDGNSMTCVAHAGMELTGYLTSNPRKKSHNTRFGQAYLLTQSEMDEIQAIAPDRELCETCEYKAGKELAK